MSWTITPLKGAKVVCSYCGKNVWVWNFNCYHCGQPTAIKKKELHECP